MKMNLRIKNEVPELGLPEITFELWGRGVKITNNKKYRRIDYTIIAGKRLAHNLHIDITSATYSEPNSETRFEQSLRI